MQIYIVGNMEEIRWNFSNPNQLIVRFLDTSVKKIILLSMVICISLWANAQATDLVVDCQTPGWLSSKISYGDQQTVRNLKVTGYINKDDLKFIGQLIEINLNGHIDLSDVNVVDNSMWNNPFSVDKNIQRLDLPKSVTYYSKCLYNDPKVLYVDTLAFEPNDISYVNADLFDKRQYGKAIKNLIVGEKVDSIPIEAFFEYDAIESVTFRGKIRYIGDRAFRVNPNLAKINLEAFDSLEYLGSVKFGEVQWVDTLYQPKKITEFPLTSFPFKENAHVFFETSLIRLLGDSYIESLNLHFKTMTPPGSNFKLNNTFTLYVPKGAKEAYLNNYYFREATIIEDNPVTEITLNEHEVIMNKGEKHSLSIAFTPEDADDRSIAWSSADKNIVTVDEEGTITAYTSGKTWVYAVSVFPEIKDSCLVIVRKNVESVDINKTQIVLSNIGDTNQLIITITPDDATDKSVTWNSSNEQICTVSSNGLVTATGVGTALVTVTTVDGGHIATCTVKVIQHVTNLSLEKHSLSMKVGDSELMYATISPVNADDKTVVWSSSNGQVASVDANGNVQALKAGEAWVKAVSVDNVEAKDSCKVTVIQLVTGVTLSKESYTFDKAGESVQLEATVLPEDASNKEVRWSSSNENVCIVQGGLVTAIAAGTATVTVTTIDGNYTATCIIKVVQHVTKVEVNKTTLTLKVGEGERLTATASPDNAENKSITWSSSNTQVVSVDANGNVQALKAGEAWIKAVSVDNAEAKDSCKVTVTQPVTGITVSPNSVRMTNIGESLQLEATVLPEDASNKEVKWSSSNNAVCVVSNGLVVATGLGTAVVMAVTTDGGYMATCAVVVEKETISVTGVSLSQTSATIKKGETLQLQATVTPEDATNKTLIWKSLDESICIVSQTGMVVAINEGQTVITVVPESGVGQAQCSVLVNNEESAIDSVISNSPESDLPVYNMMGRQVTTLKKGCLYICNGKKFIAR